MNFISTVMVAVAVIIGVVLLVIMIFTRGRKRLLDQEKYRVRWLEIENGLDKKNITTYQFAVLAADKLLDQALQELGLAGDTTNERLKNAKGKFSNLNTVCVAHKLRDRIAHGADTNPSLTTTKRALAVFKKALKELGAI